MLTLVFIFDICPYIDAHIYISKQTMSTYSSASKEKSFLKMLLTGGTITGKQLTYMAAAAIYDE